MKHRVRAIVILAALMLMCPIIRAESMPEKQILWRFDPADLRSVGGGTLCILSVSPSGKYIAAADRSGMNPAAHHTADVYNPLGRLPDAIYLFSKEGDHYTPYKTISIDIDNQEELSSLLGGGSELSWNDEEDRIIITGDWGMNSEAMAFIAQFHTNLYLLDVGDGTIKRLTENEQPCEHCILPKWTGSNTVCYVRTAREEVWSNAFCEMEIDTGSEKKVADLYCAEGRTSPVLSWERSGEQIYYTVDALDTQVGFFCTPAGGAEKDARCLIDLFAEFRENEKHPYARALTLCPQGISADGKWACLNIYDPRVLNKDIPLSDDPQLPQSDPADAVSTVNGWPWVPCHNVLLYDLKAERLADPFTGGPLDPAKVIVTGACFAPDGKSLLCAVFGDGGPWTIADYTRASFYRIDLTDSAFNAEKVFETELESSVWFDDGIRLLDDNVLLIPTGVPPENMVQMIRLK